MKRWSLVGVAVIVAALIPVGSVGYASGGGSFDEIDVVRVELSESLSGNADVNVFGTLKCDGAGDVDFDVTVLQVSTAGTGAGSNNGLTCRAGKTIKWVVTAQGEDMMVDDEIKVTVIASDSTIATETEEKVLQWGLHAGI